MDVSYQIFAVLFTKGEYNKRKEFPKLRERIRRETQRENTIFCAILWRRFAAFAFILTIDSGRNVDYMFRE